MAVIGKIRERGSLLVIIVGGALVLFIIGELISGSSGLSRGDQAVGEVAGQEIGLQEFSRRVEEITDRARQNGSTVDNQLQEQIRGQVWNELVRENTLKVEAEKAGLGSTISLEELDDIRFGNNIAPLFRNDQSVMDPATGQPSPERLREGLRNLQERDPVRFHELNVGLATDRIYQKYNTLLKKSCFVNSAQLADDYAGKNTKATFTLVGKRYDSEPDSLYPIGEEELSRFYNAHKNDRRYRQQASRSFAYVRFPATPTEGDIEAARSELAQAKAEFEAASGAKADSAFVLGFAQTKNPAATPYTEGTADHLNDSLIINAQPGTVVGPFREGNTWKLVKVTELAEVPEARVRHILLNSPGEDATIKQRADSIMGVVKRDRSKFEALVDQFSEDPGSKSTGGVYEWFDKTRMVPEFTAASFDQKVGAITIAKTSYGYHIVEVLGQRTRNERRVLTVDRNVEPVQAMKDAWKKANEFSLNHKDTADFRKAAEEAGLVYTPVAELRGDQRFVPGLQKPEEVMAWVNHAAPDAKTSEPLGTDDGYVICILRGIREAGVPKLQDVRELFTREARKEKKGDALVARMDAATDLNALATELGVQVQNATDLAFSANSLPGGFSDPKAIGSVFGVANGQTRSFKGDMGAYKVTMGTLTPAGEMPAGSEDLKVATDKVRNRAEGQAFNAIKEAAEVKDDRSRFF
ncbi:MAG TPA: peptidylprolyl isomerase [Flavobacteriales bacterium]